MAATDALCTLADLEALLQVPIAAASLPSANAAIAAASAAIRGYCRQVLSSVVADHVLLSGSCGPVYLPEVPVTAVTAITMGGVVQSAAAWAFEVATGELLRLDPLATTPPGWPLAWDTGFRNLAVTYDHGYAAIPADLADVCARVSSRRYLGGMRSALVGPHARESDYATVYQAEDRAETVGAYGPTSAVVLTSDERRVLDRRYRLARVG